ncbi:MAG: flippase-like domain-containing protein [Clostridia bacterium]|nr:flippase-like domain-containing protein [Clostridia bacterium]
MSDKEIRDGEVAETELEQLNTEAASEDTAEEVNPASEAEEVTADLNGDGTVDEDESEIDEALKSLDTKTIEPPKKHKFGWLGYVFLCGVIAVGIWLIFKIVGDAGDTKSLGDALAGGNWIFGLIAVGVLLVIMVSEWMKYSVIMKTTTGKFHLRSSLKVGLLGKFYDNVTPFAVGGQPMQIYYLHKKGFSGGVSSAVILIKYFAQMFSYTIVSLLIMACNTAVLGRIDPTWQTIITVGAWIGLVVNMFLPLMIIAFAIVPKFARGLASLVVGLGAKIKIVKDKGATMAKAEKVVSDFRAGFKIMSRKPLNFIILLFLCLLEVILTFSLPYFVMRAYSALPSDGGFELYMIVIALNVYCTQAVAVIPTPGNSGAIEGVLVSAYVAIAATSLSWALFTWRFAVYYIYIVIGMGLVIFELIRKIYRARKARKGALNPPLENTEESNQTEITENGDEEA